MRESMLKIEKCNSNILIIDNKIQQNADDILELRRYLDFIKQIRISMVTTGQHYNNISYETALLAYNTCLERIDAHDEVAIELQLEKDFVLNLKRKNFLNMLQATRIMENMNIKAINDIHSLPDFDTSNKSRQL